MSGTSKESSGVLSGTARTAASKAVSGSYGGMYVPDEPALTISDLAFTITRNAITISYSASDGATCRVTYVSAYNIELMQLESRFFSPNHSTHAHQITGLTEGTNYWIQVRAYDSSGNNAFSPAVSTWHVVKTATIDTPGEYLGIFAQT
jgi:hypothetical protein